MWISQRLFASFVGPLLLLAPIGSLLCGAECMRPSSARVETQDPGCHKTAATGSATLSAVHDCASHDLNAAITRATQSSGPSAQHQSLAVAPLSAQRAAVRLTSFSSLSPPGDRSTRSTGILPLRI
jgi:hypothetical protein